VIAAYTALHYGSPYLQSAMRSVMPWVDKYYVLYSGDGSHGTRANGLHLPATDSRENLQWIASQAAGRKLVWIDGDWHQEGQQRESIYQYARNMDMILVVDYDEIWPEATVEQTIKWVDGTSSKQYRIPMVHFWRSFRRAVLHDPAFPVRILKPSGTGECTLQTRPIAHMGYAIPTWLLDYKMHIHGHRGQWRTDIDWRKERWLANASEDCHPVGSDYWNPEPVEPFDYLPYWMAQHKYYHEEVIE
jgi:hypothetical protein